MATGSGLSLGKLMVRGVVAAALLLVLPTAARAQQKVAAEKGPVVRPEEPPMYSVELEPHLAFGAEMADQVLLASDRVLPERLSASGFTFAYPQLEPALKHILQNGPP